MATIQTPQGITWQYENRSVKGKSVLVTGGTTGIGRAIALLLAANGARVLIFGRHEWELSDALVDLKKIGAEAYGLTGDAAVESDMNWIFAEVDHRLGGLDILINNVGMAADSLEEMTHDQVNYVIQTNLASYLHFAEHAVERIKQRGGGHIINIGSLSADERGGGSPVYVATKAAVQGFSESLSKSLMEDEIKVSLVEPGAVGADIQPDRETHAKKAEDGIFLRAEDIAHAVLFCLMQPKWCDLRTIKVQPMNQSRK